MTIQAFVLVLLVASSLFATGATVPCSTSGIAVLLVLAAPLKAEQFADSIACADSRCSGHGRCHDGGWCDCDANWAGDRCDYFIKENAASILSGKTNAGQDEVELCPDDCSGHGNCEASLCNCFAGWAGAACAVQVQCPDQCNNPSGVCVDGRCVCEQGFGGSTCAERICQNGCWGHGTCVDGNCACNTGWEGEECDLPAQRIGQAAEPVAAAKKPTPMDTAAMRRLMQNASDIHPDHNTNVLLSLGSNAPSSAHNGNQGQLQDTASQGMHDAVDSGDADSGANSGAQQEEESETIDATQQDDDDAGNATAQMSTASWTEQDSQGSADGEDMQITGVDQDGISGNSGIDTQSTVTTVGSLRRKQQREQWQQQHQQSAVPPSAVPPQSLQPKQLTQAVVDPPVPSGARQSLLHNPTVADTEASDNEEALATEPAAAADAQAAAAEAEAEPAAATAATESPQAPLAPPSSEAEAEDATAATEPLQGSLAPPSFGAEAEQADATAATEPPQAPLAPPSSEAEAEQADATAAMEPPQASLAPPSSKAEEEPADAAVAAELLEAPPAPPSSQTAMVTIPTEGPPPNPMQQLQAALGSSRRALNAAERLRNQDLDSSAEANDAPGQIALPQLAVDRRVIRSKQATKGRDVDDECPEENCSGHGTCASGACQCIGGWTGEACDQQPCPGGCSGRGTCLMGTCACPPDFYGSACENARCAGDCNGHGQCMNGQCTCDRGFGGADCHPLTLPPALPSTAGAVTATPAHLASALSGWKGNQVRCPNDCSGNGRCQGGKCTCFGGYVGPSCSDYCPNYCNGNGQCTAGVCLCLSGFAGEDCSLMTCCSGHGSCDIPGTCACLPGWMGAQCELQMTCPDTTCSGHGVCTQGHCLCQGGYVGVSCDKPPAECGPCPMGSICDRATGLCLCGGIPCDAMAPPQTGFMLRGATMLAKGPASLTPGTVPAVGDASAGGIGAGSSGSTTEGAQVPNSISSGSSGLALVAGNVPARSCNSPHGVFDSTSGMCQCQPPYFGEDCQNMHCPDWDPNSEAPDCSGNGKCVDGQCVCATGYGLGPGKAGPNVCFDDVCPVDCGEHGLCKNNQCVCQEGWQGPACRLPKCVNDCSGHGSCYFLNANSLGECVCDSGFALPDCAQPAVYAQLPSCPNACSGNGLCFMGQCTCGAGFGGSDCSRASCPAGQSGPSCEFAACPRDCVGKGLCFAGECMCRDGHTGKDCSLPKQCYDACGDTCMANLESEACEFCKGQCLTLSESVLGRHDAIADSKASLLEVHSPNGHRGPLGRSAQPVVHNRTVVSQQQPSRAGIVGRAPTHGSTLAAFSSQQSKGAGLVLQQLGGVAAWGHGSASPPASHPVTENNSRGSVRKAAAPKRAPVASARRAHGLARRKLHGREASNATLGSSRYGHSAVAIATIPRPAEPTQTPQRRVVKSVPSAAVYHPLMEKSRERLVGATGAAAVVGQRGNSMQQQRQLQQHAPSHRVTRHAAGTASTTADQRLKRQQTNRGEGKAVVVVQGSNGVHHKQVSIPVTVTSHAKAAAIIVRGRGPHQASGNGGVAGAQKPAVAAQPAPKVVNRTAASAASVMRPVVVEAAITQPQPTRQQLQKVGTKHQHRHHSEVSAKRRHRHHVEVSVVRVAKGTAA